MRRTPLDEIAADISALARRRRAVAGRRPGAAAPQ